MCAQALRRNLPRGWGGTDRSGKLCCSGFVELAECGRHPLQRPYQHLGLAQRSGVVARRRDAARLSFAAHLALLLVCDIAGPVARLAQALAELLQLHP